MASRYAYSVIGTVVARNGENLVVNLPHGQQTVIPTDRMFINTLALGDEVAIAVIKVVKPVL